MDPVFLLMLLCLGIGAVAGIMAGLLGIGGGLIIVPTLIFLFQHLLGMSIENAMPIAVATSLSTVIFTGLSSARSHYTLGNLDKNIFKYSAFGIAVGAVAGAQFASMISGVMLQRIFAALVILIALQMVFNRHRRSEHEVNKGILGGIGLGSGFVSALMGIGGGALIVPALVWFRVNIKKAIGCASACGVVIAIFGTASFIYAGWNRPYLPAYSLGYVYLPATLGIVITSMLTARIGAKLTSKLDTVKLKRIFAVFLVLVSIRMMIGIE
ncbi:sulfite exporter TauE/SafE family protein [Glaciecola siphonariae]|uniref:Probable membrane transporter protein n=1 Tax=Glaciecola siphonariae TaxID=521012 RepID=A0ABV9LYG5_9ALTE